MPTPETVEIAALLAPISPEHPSGDSLDAATYDALKEATRGGGRSQLGDDDGRPPDWRQVAALASRALATGTKDLLVAAWLTEALTQTHGFAGLRDGLRVLRGLHEAFWDTVHPQVEDGDLEFRAGRLSYLNDSSEGSGRQSLPAAVEAISLTDPASGAAYGYADWRESRETDNLGRQDPGKYAAALAAGRLTGEQFDAAVAQGKRAFYERLAADATEALAECDRLQAVVSERFGKNAPSLLNVRRAVEECHDLLGRFVAEKRRLEPDAFDEAAPVAAESAAGAAPQPSGPLPLDPRDRADAVRRLAAVAAFFKRTEPHSPVSYLVQKAMRWAEMPLEGWLQEVLADDAAMTRVREMLGIKTES